MANSFIGQAAVTQLAIQITPDIAMSAYYNREAVFNKLGIKVISGSFFKDVKYTLLRKGHTARRKQVGSTLRSSVGTLLERPLTTYLAWNRYKDNQDSYRELAIRDELTGTDSYPASELAMRAILSTYAEDVFDNVFHGDHEYGDLDPEDEKAYLGLFDGFCTYLRSDIEHGRLKPIHLSGTIAAPVNSSDSQAYQLFLEFRSKWHSHLRNAPRVIVMTNSATAEAIADAYGNSKNNHKEVEYLPNGNYKFPHIPNVEIAFDDALGVGTKMIATIPDNFEYGIDTMNPENGIDVQFGSENDAKDIFFQVQSAQGTRVVRIDEAAMAITDAPLAPADLSSDYYEDIYSVLPNDAALGKVQVDGEDVTEQKAYEAGTTLTLKAVALDGAKFVRWSNGMTDAEIKVVTKGQLESIVAYFVAE